MAPLEQPACIRGRWSRSCSLSSCSARHSQAVRSGNRGPSLLLYRAASCALYLWKPSQGQQALVSPLSVSSLHHRHTQRRMDHRLPESQAHWHAPEYAAPTNHHGSTRASGETTGQQPGEGSYRRVFQLPAQPTNKSNHTSNRGGWTSPSHLPPLPILPPSRSASTSASDSPTASGLPLSATLSPYYQSQPATYDWATQALPSMRLKPPTPPLTHPSGRRPHLQPLAPFGGSREGQPRRAYSEDGEQARFHSSVLALTSLASHGVEPEEDQATSSGGSNESGRGGVDLPHKTYASTDSEDGGDGVASDGKKKRKRRRKANEEPRDAAMRRFVCQADGCDKSFAR